MSGSKEKLQKAFLALLGEKPFEKITIKEIVERAGVSRASYYRHYYTQMSLLEQIIDDFFAELSNIPEKNGVELPFHGEQDWRFKAVVYQMLLCYKKHGRELKCILESTVGSVLEKRIYEYLDTEFRPKTAEGAEQVVSAADINRFCAAGFVRFLHDWIVSDCAAPVEEMLDFTLRISELAARYARETQEKQ